jgi:NADPH:quinone reductase-like Zn-dependent oxidoreductase
MGYVIKAFMLRPFSSKIAKMYLANPDFKELDFISGLIDQGKLRPVIDKTYPFQKIPEAVEYIGKGHAHGKVVITIKGEKDLKK